MAGTQITHEQFEGLNTEDQISALNAQVLELEQQVASISDQQGKSIMQKIAGFIKIFLLFTVNMFNMVKGFVGTTSE